MLHASAVKSHSARVDLRLDYAGGSVELGQVSSEWIMADQSVELPPGDGVVVMTVDGREHRRAVRLPCGMSASTPKTPIERLTV